MSQWSSLPFEERQKQWGGGWVRQFRQHHGRADRPTVWEIWVDKNDARVYTKHGLLGGQMQETNYVGKLKNVGKKNEISPEQDAIAEARRDIRKKWDFEGYDEYSDDVNLDKRNADISVQHLLTNLPGSFCLYKPENELEDQKKLFALANAGKALHTLKRDGVAMWVVVDFYGNIQFYSRRSRPWSDTEEPTERPDGTLDFSTAKPWALRFPHLVEEVKRLGLPNGTMMAVELVAVNPVTGKDDLRISSGYTKGLTERSLEDQKANLPSFYWWDVPFYAGADLVRTMRAADRYNSILEHCASASVQYIQPIMICNFPDAATALESAETLGIEGWVVVDPDAIYGDRGWNLKGKPDRPSTCAKSKPTEEDDFIAYWDPDKKNMGKWGVGKNEVGKEVELPNGQKVIHGGVGSVALYQYNPNGELVYISKCSSGMAYEFQAQLRHKDFPFVCKVEYKGRTYISDGEDTNALRHPVFVEVRTDKTAAECVSSKL